MSKTQSNRLRLDFSLSTTEERSAFIEKYITQENFQKKPLTNDELETIANYVLWGKDSDGLNCTQRKEIQIETKNRTWDRQNVESLDAIMESPTFNEASFKRQTEARPRITRETFDRNKTLQSCPAHFVPIFQDLFHRIDTIELGTNFYELKHNRRVEQPRPALLDCFTQQEIDRIQQAAEKWTQYFYLKQRHLIVELRREQFTLRDSFVEQIVRKAPIEPDLDPCTLDFEVEVPVYPLGLASTPIGGLVFREKDKLHPNAFEESEIEKIISFYWQKKEQDRPALYFDFCELEHVYEFFDQLNDLEESVETLPPESNMGRLLQTLRYYIEFADLNEVQREILDMKIQKVKNLDIAIAVNKKYDKSYTANYISTIYRQKIIPKINEGAKFHSKIVENLTFKENFKKCSSCGQVLLIDGQNFVHKTRSKDGFSSKCKRCERNERLRKKGRELI